MFNQAFIREDQNHFVPFFHIVDKCQQSQLTFIEQPTEKNQYIGWIKNKLAQNPVNVANSLS